MKKKLITSIAALTCAAVCAFGLAACNNDGKEVTTLTIDENIITVNYGETPDLSQYKLFVYYTGGEYEEIARNHEKLSVKYYYQNTLLSDVRKEINELPAEWIRGSYTVEYVYDGKTEMDYTTSLTVEVVWSNNGAFTVQPQKTSWNSNEALPEVILKNPNNVTVNQTVEQPEKPNDTDGQFDLYYFAKSDYDAFTDEQKSDYNFIENNAKRGYYNAGENLYEGDYMVLAIIRETHNYRNVVTPAVKITVTGAAS